MLICILCIYVFLLLLFGDISQPHRYYSLKEMISSARYIIIIIIQNSNIEDNMPLFSLGFHAVPSPKWKRQSSTDHLNDHFPNEIIIDH